MPEEIPKIEEVKNESEEREKRKEVVNELERPIKTILLKLKERIDRGEYGLVIGDDASGRIPTIIIGGVMREVAGRHGNKKPNIIFIPGGLSSSFTAEDEEEFGEYLKKRGLEDGRRVLVVTDSIMSGSTLKGIVAQIHNLEFECDIATIGIEDVDVSGTDMRKDRTRNLPVDIVSGEYKNSTKDIYPHTPDIYDDKDASGVFKMSGDFTSEPLARPGSSRYHYTNTSPWDVQDRINESRPDAHDLRDKLIDWYESRTKSSSPS